ncbi:Gfo/Idh/MocA family protein [Cohnella fermenti]|uniref:Gfo/Idh/MocA family oxidoreductase n=1 Tax=Cohnella fermenti TaxID=2565925 RepID=A0A4S4BVH7_9BACL|nr:Gfo/Idh/MocA family oxidoreductase [Cohnella fermenti]THF79129.1 Gfo/Idh/MocA family oxidoreductase [Cohnella fermenti]
MSKLRIGIVGTGKIFENAHAPAWLSSPHVEVTAVSDVYRPAAETQAKRFGTDRVYTDYMEMLEREKLDAIDICAPNVLHSEIAVAALERGIHVFCEKPDAVDAAGAERMADAAARSGKLLMVMRNNRFSPQAQFLKRYIESGAMGDIYSARAVWLRRRGIPGRGGWFTTKAMSGGGPLIDLGVHMIDVAIWLMGSPKPVAVSGAAYTKFADSKLTSAAPRRGATAGGVFDVEDLAAGFIRFDNGATMQIEFSWASNIEEDVSKLVELRGTRAGAMLRNRDLKLVTEIEGAICDIVPQFPKDDTLTQWRNIHHFIDCLIGEADPISTPETGVDMIRILSAIYESAATGAEVRLDEAEQG